MNSSADPDQTPRLAASDLGLHCLLRPVFPGSYVYYCTFFYSYRVIYKWMTTKNLQTIKFEKYPEGSAEELFQKLQNKETTYAKVYAVICG